MRSEAISFAYFQERLEALAGIHVTPSKEELIRSRLRRRLQALGLASYEDYERHLRTIPSADLEWQEFVNELTTNKTDFYREREHFDLLLELVARDRLQINKPMLNVWCAASSTGEEPYTLAMILTQAREKTGGSFRIVASDVDTKVLDTARKGVYRRERLAEIPQHLHAKYFMFGTDDISQWVRIKDEIKEHVTFRTLNLVKTPYRLPASFDVIFCRNVLIYFSQETVRKVAEALYDAAAPGAYLFIGHSETLNSVKTRWTYVRPSIYRKRPDGMPREAARIGAAAEILPLGETAPKLLKRV